MDRGAWWATVQGVAKSWTWLKRLSTHKMTLSKFDLKEESSTYRYKINIIYSHLMMVLTANLYLRIYHMLSDLDIFCHFLSQILFYCFKNRKVGLKMIRKLVQNYVAGMWHSRNLKKVWNQGTASHIFTLLLLFSLSVGSNSLGPHGLQHTRLPCPSLSPEFAQTQAIESGMSCNHLILCCPVFLLPSVFPSIRIFSNERLFASSGQSIRTSASASVLPMNILSPSLYTEKIREQQTNYFSLCS